MNNWEDDARAQSTPADTAWESDARSQSKPAQQTFLQKAWSGIKNTAAQMFPRAAQAIQTEQEQGPQSSLLGIPASSIPGKAAIDVAAGVGHAIGSLPPVQGLSQFETGLNQKMASGMNAVDKGNRQYPLQNVAAAAESAGVPPWLAETAGRMATQPSTYAGGIASKAAELPWVANAAQKVSEATPEFIAGVTSKLNKVSPEALLKASTPEGRTALAQAAEKIKGSGASLSSDAASVMDMPEKARVDAAAAGFNGSLDRNGLVNAILSAKKNLPAGVQDPDLALANSRIESEANAYLGKPPERLTDEQFNNQIRQLEIQRDGTKDFQTSNKIQGQIEALKESHAANPPLDPNISALDALALQRHLGTKANYLDPNAGALNNARKAGYDYLKTGMEDLATKNNNPQFITDKASMADRFELNEELQDMIGKEEGSRQDIKAANFLKGIWNKGPNGSFDDAALTKQNLLARLDAKQGTNWLGQSKQMALSREFGPQGKPQWLPKNIPTAIGEMAAGGGGAAAMAHYGLPLAGELTGAATAAALAGSSPALAVRAINASRLPPWLIQKTLQNSPVLSAAGAASQDSLPPWMSK